MPNYTYVCEDCHRAVILNRGIADRDEPGVQCLCGGKLHRTPDAPEFTVKGGTPKFHGGR